MNLKFFQSKNFFVSISSLSVYCVLGAGWCSNSKYSLLGSLRSVAQTISYEVSMVLILLSSALSFSVFELNHMHMNSNSFLIMSILPFSVLWFVSCLAETNRTPFDFSEGESELVSGFNTEYSAGMFAFIFMSEYLNIIMMSLMTSVLFFSIFNFFIMGDLLMLIFTFFFSVLFIWIRGSLPRVRYAIILNFLNNDSYMLKLNKFP